MFPPRQNWLVAREYCVWFHSSQTGIVSVIGIRQQAMSVSQVKELHDGGEAVKFIELISESGYPQYVIRLYTV